MHHLFKKRWINIQFNDNMYKDTILHMHYYVLPAVKGMLKLIIQKLSAGAAKAVNINFYEHEIRIKMMNKPNSINRKYVCYQEETEDVIMSFC